MPGLTDEETMDHKLTYSYPANFQKSDREIFYFLGSSERTPSFQFTRRNDCYWDVAHERAGNLLSNGANILMAYAGVRKKLFQIKKAAWITDAYSANYFHWINDSLPKLIFLEEQGIHCEVLLPEHFTKIGFIRESLELLGWNYKTVSLNTICRIGQLFLPTITGGAGAQHPYYFKTLCNRLIRTRQEPHRKVFISRENTNSRNVIPHDEFKTLLVSKGIEIIKTDSLSLNEQIEIFTQCSHLIAVHGAGLTNMAFMPTRGNVLELRRGDDKLNYCYFKMANVLHHTYYYYLGRAETIEKSVQQDNLVIDIDEIEKVLDKFLLD